MKTESVKEFENIRIMTQRFQLITVSRYRDRSKIQAASKEIDKIRSKVKSNISMTDTIRKWRDSRYAASS